MAKAEKTIWHAFSNWSVHNFESGSKMPLFHFRPSTKQKFLIYIKNARSKDVLWQRFFISWCFLTFFA